MECTFNKKNMSIMNLKIKVKNSLFLKHLILKKVCLRSYEIYLLAGNYIFFILDIIVNSFVCSI